MPRSSRRIDVARACRANRSFSAAQSARQHPELVVLHNLEATELEAAISASDALEPASDAWGLPFERLLAVVQQHVEEESRTSLRRRSQRLVKPEQQPC